MADDFEEEEEDDEYGKTVMSPSPFAGADTKAKPAAPKIASLPESEIEPPQVLVRARRTRSEPTERFDRSRHIAENDTRREPEDEEYRSRPSAEPSSPRSRRLLAPVIAGGVLLLGIGIAAGIFIAGNGPAVGPASVAVVPTAVLPPPVTAAAAAPAVAVPVPAAVTPPPPQAVTPRPASLPPPQPAAVVAPPPAPPEESEKPKVHAHKREQAVVVVGAGDSAAAVHSKKSYLVVKTIPGVKIFVDNTPVGVSPLAGPLEVHVGSCFVTLVAPDGRKKGYQVDIAGGDTYNLSEDF